jgi:hypothetical protein
LINYPGSKPAPPVWRAREPIFYSSFDKFVFNAGFSSGINSCMAFAGAGLQGLKINKNLARLILY